MKTKKQLNSFWYAVAIALFLLPALQPGAQAANVDSLEHVLQTGKLSNKERLRLYYNLYVAYRNNDETKAKDYMQRGLTLAVKEKDRPKQMSFLYIKGDAFMLKDEMDSALYYFEEAHRLAQELGDKKNEKIMDSHISVIYHAKGMFTLALQRRMEALPYVESEGDKEIMAEEYLNIGLLYPEILNYEKSLYYLSKAEALFRELGDKDGLAAVMLATAVYIPKVRGKAIYRDKAAMDSLIASVRQVMELQKEINHRNGLGTSYEILSEFYMEMDDYANAQAYLDSAVSLGIDYDDASNQRLQASLYYRQGKYAEYEETVLKAIALEDTVYSHFPILYGDMKDLVLSNIKLGNAEGAEKYFDKYSEKIKKYMEEEYQKNMSEMEVIYETGKKEVRIASLEKERTLYFWLSCAAAVILLLGVLPVILWRKQVEKEKQLIAVQSVLDGEMTERTRLARDLHDGLGGLLSVIRLNVGELRNGALRSPEEATRFDQALTLLNEASVELRRMSYNLMPEPLVRSGLKVSLADFCGSIPNVGFRYLGAGNRLDPRLEVMIYRTAHELVNNALRHAEAKHILVQIIEEGNRLSLVVHDDGQGFDPKVAAPGIGLKNIRNRVAANNGHLEISSKKGNGTEISVEFKL
jgi:signal transduction histidine kinase